MRDIRAALCHDAYTAHQSVEHDNANVICMGPRVIGPEVAEDLLKIWIKAEFTGEERHLRRLKKVEELERMEQWQ
jgi:ribose 5-phosphate isomerase B